MTSDIVESFFPISYFIERNQSIEYITNWLCIWLKQIWLQKVFPKIIKQNVESKWSQIF